MNRIELVDLIRSRKSFLCVGLDPQLDKLPAHLANAHDGIFEFNKAIIDATYDFAVAYKPNLAFYEGCGLSGLRQLKLTMDYLHSKPEPRFVIADAKRGDIGNTAKQYASAFFNPKGDFNFDAITIAPYMGADAVLPFTEYPDKWTIVLALTSNKGAEDFQFVKDSASGLCLYEKVLMSSLQWGSPDNMMFVVGATKAEMLSNVRAIAPRNFLLVPGVGAQGGSLDEVCRYGLNSDCGLLVNSSRGIIYSFAGHNDDTHFASYARSAAQQLQQQMATILANKGL